MVSAKPEHQEMSSKLLKWTQCGTDDGAASTSEARRGQKT